jgi:hypothetical protein
MEATASSESMMNMYQKIRFHISKLIASFCDISVLTPSPPSPATELPVRSVKADRGKGSFTENKSTILPSNYIQTSSGVYHVKARSLLQLLVCHIRCHLLTEMLY